MKIFIATKNKKKLKELERILIPMGFEVYSLNDYSDQFPDVEETGNTFEENALLKAKAGLAFSSFTSVADDSGLCVDFLGGAPGVYSARYAGEPSNDENNNAKLLAELSGVPQDKRTAKYVSAIACVFPNGKNFTVTGECKGYISEKPEGTGGFGYDPLFVGEKGPMALLSPDEKDSISHRGKSLRLFETKIKEYLKDNVE